MNYIEECEKQITVWFKDHKATLTDLGEIQHLCWKNPNSGYYRVDYWLDNNGNLFITGDMGSAVYRYYRGMNFYDIASDHISYFQSKCVASENGRDNKVWDEGMAEERMIDFLSDDDSKITVEQFIESGGKDALQSLEDFMDWLDSSGWLSEFLDHWETIASIGKVDDIRAVAYLVGIKMACEQMKG